MELDFPQRLQHKIEKKVLSSDTAAFHKSGDLEVFATPAMIALMEQTAQESLIPYLPNTETTVGVSIEALHKKATPVNANVYCLSTLVNQEDRKFDFEISVFDENGLVGEAKHTRFQVNREKFMQKLK